MVGDGEVFFGRGRCGLGGVGGVGGGVAGFEVVGGEFVEVRGFSVLGLVSDNVFFLFRGEFGGVFRREGWGFVMC